MEPLREELNGTIRGDGGKSLESLRQELKAMQDELENLNSPDAYVPLPIPIMGSEHVPVAVLEHCRLLEEDAHNQRRRAHNKRQARLKSERESSEALIEKTLQRIKEREARIEETLQHIKKNEASSRKRLIDTK